MTAVMVEQIADEITDALSDLFASEYAVDRSPDKLDRLPARGGRRAGRFVSWVDWGLGVEIVVAAAATYGCAIFLLDLFVTSYPLQRRTQWEMHNASKATTRDPTAPMPTPKYT